MAKTRVEEFKDWLKHSRVGQVHIYYQGNLALNRGTIIDVTLMGLPEEENLFIPNGDVHELGTLAMDAFENGNVHLFQRKLRDNEYQYIAMKRRNMRIW